MRQQQEFSNTKHPRMNRFERRQWNQSVLVFTRKNRREYSASQTRRYERCRRNIDYLFTPIELAPNELAEYSNGAFGGVAAWSALRYGLGSAG